MADIELEITLRNGQLAQGRLRWPARSLDAPALSGPFGNGALPEGLYSVGRNQLLDKAPADRSGAYCDSLQRCWLQALHPQFSTTRTDLAIHPDGNVRGTEGCIGLLDADCRPWYEAFRAQAAGTALSLEVKSADGVRVASFAPVFAAASAASWPQDQQADLENFYGSHVLGPDGRPTAQWERDNLTSFAAPYPMFAAWDHSLKISKIRCHQKVAASLELILRNVLSHFGSVAAIQRNRMHLFGGIFNYRPIRSGTRLSVHAWGAAIDLDPENNPLGKPYSAGIGMIPLEVVDIFEAEGWKWGGRFSSRPDCMHFQATR